jgi:phage tail sheath protein FI
VWKAPANIVLMSVLKPMIKITAEDEDILNVSPDGKSINGIRSFVGKGTLVWGARTMAGIDNEWRYISIRRLFNMIETSAIKASYFVVFEPNDASTWLKVKGILESYLYGLWQQGALAGKTPEEAYFVHVGLGITMTALNITEGKLIVELGVAAVRPQEFITLMLVHKLNKV